MCLCHINHYELNALQGRHNERDGVSNNQLHDCLLKRLSRRKSKTTSKLRVTALCAGNSSVTGEFPAHKRPVTRKIFPFDHVIMVLHIKTKPNKNMRIVHLTCSGMMFNVNSQSHHISIKICFNSPSDKPSETSSKKNVLWQLLS